MTPGYAERISELGAALARLEAQQRDATRSITADRWLILIGCVALLIGGIGAFSLVYANFTIALVSILIAALGWLVSAWAALKLARDRKKLRQVQGLIKELQKHLADAWITRVNRSSQS